MTHSTPLVSVLVCNYNYGKYISETLESILQQDYKNLEIVIVDDGSQDNSVEKINTFVDKHPEATFSLKLKSKNQGICYARNDAIDMAKGEHFIFLDSDDTIPSGYISTLYKTAVEKKADVVYSDVKSFGDDTTESHFQEYNAEDLLIHNYINISCLVKTSKIGNHRFDTSLNRKTLEDYDFWMGLSLMGLKFVKAKNAYLNYRVQNQSRNENTGSLENKILKLTEVWHYSISKYRKLYPEKIKLDVEIEELKYQIGQMGDLERDLHKLDKAVHGELIPELKRREEHIDYLNATIEELKRQNHTLENSFEHKVGSTLLKPVRAVKRKLSK